jgi:hypothetical protein
LDVRRRGSEGAHGSILDDPRRRQAPSSNHLTPPHPTQPHPMHPSPPLPQLPCPPSPSPPPRPHQGDVDALLQAPPQRLVNVPREVGGGEYDDVLPLLALLAVAAVNLGGAGGRAAGAASMPCTPGLANTPTLAPQPCCAPGSGSVAPAPAPVPAPAPAPASPPPPPPPPPRPRTCTSSSLFTRRDASCSPSAPRCVHSESISSMKITEGAYARASSNRQRTWGRRGAEGGGGRVRGPGARGGADSQGLHCVSL